MTTETPRGTATYSPDDNKLRFYPLHRLSTEDYTTIKAAGFSWAPKQELFVAGNLINLQRMAAMLKVSLTRLSVGN